MTHLIVQYGLVILFLLVAMESAGVPLPGETALVTAAVLAKDHWGIEWVIVVAAAGAIVGDNIGYWLGRLGGRKVIERYEITRRYADRALPPSERFFKKHGGKTIFLARFIAVLRVTAAWIAGISRMHWWQFFLWNAAGAVGRYGLYGAGVVIVGGALVLLGVHLWRRRLVGSEG